MVELNERNFFRAANGSDPPQDDHVRAGLNRFIDQDFRNLRSLFVIHSCSDFLAAQRRIAVSPLGLFVVPFHLPYMQRWESPPGLSRYLSWQFAQAVVIASAASRI